MFIRVHSWKEKRAAAQVVEIQVVAVGRRIVVEWGGRFSDRPYCGALASSGYLAAGASGGDGDGRKKNGATASARTAKRVFYFRAKRGNI